MSVHARSVRGALRGLVLMVATAFLTVVWGCGGGVPPQANLDDEAKARIQKAYENQKAFLAKPKKRKEDRRPESKRL